MNMKSFGPKAWELPQPVLIIGTYDKEGKANAMNAAHHLRPLSFWLYRPRREGRKRIL